MITESQMRLLALCSIRVEGKSVDWSLLARSALRGHLDSLCDGIIREDSPAAKKALPILREGLKSKLSDQYVRVEQELRLAEKAGAKLVTALDSSYPVNLRGVNDLPPFLFYRGNLDSRADAQSVAVVGTRDATEVGISRAKKVTRELGKAGFTIASGLARGIDTAAHTTALDFSFRTVAVIGTGITKCYPKENATLADEIARRGVVVSQFWPSRSPGRDTFPRRNHVTSGISLGSVVIEASGTSGAKMQARIATEQGRHVLLLRSLVEKQPWARKMVDSGRATQVDDAEQMIESLRTPARTPPRPLTGQLTFDVE
ncbi:MULTISPECIES: DNA-processing protein DprA [Streptomyces]|uniref:DNA-processing protein DprA n=1 Tax=Streptomyces xinghaiensis TaxID=1038928 RepID=A0A3R7IR86_9ACTN|nr:MULTISPECIES: DNA-processing protein DprA [Streptomyces]PQM21510.1 DNA-processing protein DprA [Streptomyces xinghaiensis]RKM94429.1 DNA-processing protein DprA [Streptomyces xinghaiensis]RNC72029.1 DNA-processing protein DprA [Streptomyces xinghaiensis]